MRMDTQRSAKTRNFQNLKAVHVKDGESDQ